MRSKCNHAYYLLKISFSLTFITLMTLGTAPCVVAQTESNGTKIPAAPFLKRQSDDAPDPEFKSPLKSNTRYGASSEQTSQAQQFYSKKKARMAQAESNGADREHRSGGPGGDFGAPGEPGSGFSAPGAGGMEGGMTGQRGDRRRGAYPNARSETFGAGMRQRPGGMSGSFIPHRLDLSQLNLTEEQKQQISTLRQSTREKAKDIRRSMLTKSAALRSLIFSADATEVQIKQARKEMRKIQDQMDDLQLEELLQMRSLLNDEQKRKLSSVAPPLPGQGEPPGNPDPEQNLNADTSNSESGKGKAPVYRKPKSTYRSAP